MKKIVIVFMVLFAVGLTGGLHYTLDQFGNLGQEMTGAAYLEQLLPEMPDAVLNPVSVIPLY